MFRTLKNKWLLSRLSDERYKKLFDDAPQNEWVAFDCETTGLNPKADEIVSIGAVKIKDNTVCTSERFYVLTKTDKEVTKESIKAHHIRNVDLENAKPIKEAIDEFVDFIGGRVMVGYYLEFDRAMIDKYLKTFGNISSPNSGIDISAMYFDKKNDPLGSKNVDLRFESIMKDLGLPMLGAHNAYYDALMTALAFVKLKNLG